MGQTTAEQLVTSILSWDGRDVAEARRLVAEALALPTPPVVDAAFATLARWKRAKDAPDADERPYPAAWVAGWAGGRSWHGKDGVAAALSLAVALDVPETLWSSSSTDVRAKAKADFNQLYAMGYVIDDPDDEAFHTLCDLVRYRLRHVWTRAALSLSRYVSLVPESRGKLAAFLEQEGLSERHRYVVSFAAAARGAPLPGLDETWLVDQLRRGLDPKKSNRNAEHPNALLGTAIALANDGVPAARLESVVGLCLQWIRTDRAAATFQTFQALRDLARCEPLKHTLSDDDWTLLLGPVPGKRLPLQVGALVDAGATLLWLEESNTGPDRVPRLLAERLQTAPGVAAWARAAKGGATPQPPDEAAVARLRLLSAPIWHSTPDDTRVTALAELAWILRHPALADRRWAALTSRAGLTLRVGADEDTVAQAGDAGLLALLSELGDHTSWMELEHSTPVAAPDDLLVGLVRLRSGKEGDKRTKMAATLVMRRLVAMEVKGESGKDLAEFLHKLFVADAAGARLAQEWEPDEKATKKPKSTFWGIVRDQLPGANGRCAQLARRMAVIDTMGWTRPKGAARLLERARVWVAAVQETCGLTPEGLEPGNVAAPRGMPEQGGLAEAKKVSRPPPAGKAKHDGEQKDKASSAAFPSFIRMLAAADEVVEKKLPYPANAIDTFARCIAEWSLDEQARVPFIEAARDLDRTIVAAAKDGRITDEEFARIELDLHALRDRAADTATETFVKQLQENVLAWAHDAHDLHKEVRRCIESGEEEGLAALQERWLKSRPKTKDEKPPAAPTWTAEAGRFWLRRLEFRRAQALRNAGAQVPSRFAFYAPLIVGISTGPLTTLQVTEFADGLIAGEPWKFILAALASLGASVGLLWSDLRNQTRGLAPALARQRAWKPGAALLLFTFLTSGLVWLLRTKTYDQPLKSAVVWTSLSLFQGVFLGLIAQDRGSAKKE
jgi:hypothetical protein